MPEFTMNEVSSTCMLIVTFFFSRRLIESELADWAINTFSEPGSLIRKDAISEKKLRTGLWKLCIHVFAVGYGLWALPGEEYFWDTRQLWIGYHEGHPLTPAIFWYYMIELAYYCTEMLTHFISVQRKDFWQLLLHHVVTLLLITSSYYHNFFRIGTLIMLYHDIMDPFLELAKLAKQLNQTTLSIVMTALLTISYTYTRLYVIPFHIWYSINAEAPGYLLPLDHSGSALRMYYVCNVLIAVLMLLNVMWAYFLYSAIFRLFRGRELVDTRSDDEDGG